MKLIQIRVAVIVGAVVIAMLPIFLFGYTTLAQDTPTALAPISSESSTGWQPFASQDMHIQAAGLYTWVQDTQADWLEGALTDLDATTTPGILQLAQQISGGEQSITSPDQFASGQDSAAIAVDGLGGVHAVWWDSRAGTSEIYYAYRPSGGVWTANERISDSSSGSNTRTPVIAVDDSGNLYVMWSDSGYLYFVTRPSGGGWSMVALVNQDPGSMGQTNPALAVDGSGNVYALWMDDRDSIDVYFSYRPAGGVWSPSQRVNDDAGLARQYSPDISVDSNGNAYAVWDDERNGILDIYFSYRPAGGRWGANTKVNDDTQTFHVSPDIAVGLDGTAYVVWSDGREYSNAVDVYIASRTAAGVWSANEAVFPGGVGGYPLWQYGPSLAVDHDGNLYVAAYTSEPETAEYPDIHFVYHPAGGVWQTAEKVNDNLNSAFHRSPKIVVDSTNKAYLAWTDNRNGNNDIYFAERPSGGAWSANEKVTDDAGLVSQVYPVFATDANDNLYAVWEDSRDGSPEIYFSTMSSGGTWETEVKIIDAPPTATLRFPDLAVDGNGNAYAIWMMDTRDGETDIYSAYRPVNGTWGASVRVNDDTGGAGQWNLAITVDSNGNAYAIWRDYRNSAADVYFSQRSVSGAWSPNEKVNDSASGNTYRSDLAVDGSGNVYAVWEDKRDGDYNIYFAYRPSTGSWEPNVKVNDDVGTASQGDPVIAVDSSGNATAIWSDSRQYASEMYSAFRPAGGVWGANSPVSEMGNPGINPSIAIQGSSIHIAYQGRNEIYYNTTQFDAAWPPTAYKLNSSSTAGNPTLAADSTGMVYVGWEDWRYGSSAVYYSILLATPQYRQLGSYSSQILDTQTSSAQWGVLHFYADIPAGSALAFETRSKASGGSWSDWLPLDTGGEIASPSGQYLQHRAAFSTTDHNITPRLDRVEVTYNSVGVPSAPRFVTPCGITNQISPTISGSAVPGSVIHLFVDGSEVLTQTANWTGSFSVSPNLSVGNHVITAAASNAAGIGPASYPLLIAADLTLDYDPLAVRAGQWSKDGWQLSPPRDINGCANPYNHWQVWPRSDQPFRVQVPVSYSLSAAVTVTLGTQSITLTEESPGLFAGVFQPPIYSGEFIIQVKADDQTTVIPGAPVLIDPDGFVYDASGTISDTITGVKVTCYYSDTFANQWVVWDAWNYEQTNPQITLSDGYYSFYTPPGIYRVTAEKKGYIVYTSPILVVIDKPVRHNIPLRKLESIYLPVVTR